MGQSRQFETRMGPCLLCGGESGVQALGVAPGPGGVVQLPRGGCEEGCVQEEVGAWPGAW